MSTESKIGRRSLGMTFAAVALVAVVAAAITIRFAGGLGGGRLQTPIEDYDEKMRRLREIDPKLVWYRESGQVETGFREARGIAVDRDGRLYVAGDRAIRLFRADGSPEVRIALDGTPYCVAVAEDGTIYAGMNDHVQVYDRNGTPLARWDLPGAKAHITSVAAAGNGIYVADAGSRSVLRYDSKGRLIGELGKRDAARNVPGLVVPSPHLDIAESADGSLWVANPGRHQFELYDTDGKVTRQWGEASFAIDGFSGCCNPTDFAMLPDGRFVTSEKGLRRVKVYDPDGKFECVVAGPDAFGGGKAGSSTCDQCDDPVGLDIACDSRGRVFILDPASSSVRIFVRKEAAEL